MGTQTLEALMAKADLKEGIMYRRLILPISLLGLTCLLLASHVPTWTSVGLDHRGPLKRSSSAIASAWRSSSSASHLLSAVMRGLSASPWP